MTARMFDAALRYLRAGQCPIPVSPDELKKPRISAITPYRKRRPTEQQLKRWFLHTDSNIALLTGHYGLVALDFDDYASFDAWVYTIGRRYVGPTEVDPTWLVQTGRGVHVWFSFVGEDCGNDRNFTHGPYEVLLRAKGAYMIVPPSIHHTGRKYTTVTTSPPLDIDSIDKILQDWQPKTSQKPRTAKKQPARSYHTGIRIETLIEPLSKPNARGAALARCPFHEDKNPSAWVNVEQQRFGCNKCCPDGYWDVVNVYAKLENISNGEAFKQLKSPMA